MEKWQANIDNGMTQEKYLMLCEQIGEEPNPDKMPPDVEDFPPDIHKAIDVFAKLGDRVYPEVGYVGKDYTALPLHMEVAGVKNKQVFLEMLLRLDAKLIDKMAAKMKAERDKIKAKR